MVHVFSFKYIYKKFLNDSLYTGQIIALGLLWVYGGMSTGVFDALSLFLTCFFVCGNYSLLNYSIPSDLDSEVIGTAVGLMTMTGYIASGLGGFTMHL